MRRTWSLRRADGTGCPGAGRGGGRIAEMPFGAPQKMSDTDRHPMHLFLRGLEPRAPGSH